MGPLPVGAFIYLVSSCFLMVGYKEEGKPLELGLRFEAVVDVAPVLEDELTAGLLAEEDGIFPLLTPRAFECGLELGTGTLLVGMLGPPLLGYYIPIRDELY